VQSPRTLLIACGALGREVVALKDMLGLDQLDITCLPAIWHNHPERIPAGVRSKIRSARGRYDHILVAYADCGTGGELDRVLIDEGVDRISGPHCYQFFMGTEEFTQLVEAEPTCFFLTDYLVRHFDRLIIKGLGIDRHPELLAMYFGNYVKLVHIAQIEDARLEAKAEAAATRLGLAHERRYRGYGELAEFMEATRGQE